jgi:ferritin-like metal-binding protein YciE
MCLFMEELADAHNAEQQLTKALPKMVKFAQSSELKEAFESHLEETRNHITRLEQAAESFGQSIGKKKCQGMEGIVDEGEDMADDFEDSPACDAALIAAAQKVEHYEIASYGTLCTWAQTLGHTEALELLRENLEEEKQADEKLTRIAESAANIRAEQEEEEEEV